MKRTLFSLALIIVLVAFCQAQQPAPAQPAFGQELPYTEILVPPMPVAGVRMPLVFLADQERNNFLRGSVQATAAFDDNILTTLDNTKSDFSYLLAPSIEIGQDRSRWQWNFGYAPGFVINQRFSERNQAAHNLHMLLGYRVTPHVTLQVHENFEKSNTLFSGVLGSRASSNPGGLEQPNTSLVLPMADRTGNSSGLDLTYQFAANSLVGASANYYFANYGAVANPAEARLFDTRSWLTNAFYAHRFHNRHWAGVTYNFQRLMYEQGARTDLNRFLVFYSLSVNTHTTISLWAGPERNENLAPLAEVLVRPRWSVAGGALATWQTNRTALRLAYTRQTTDGAGLAETVRMQSVEGELRHRLTSRWTASTSATYGRNDPLNLNASVSPLRSWMVNGGFDWRLRGGLEFGARYGRDQLQYVQAGSPADWASRNRAWISLSYSFTRPLGR